MQSVIDFDPIKVGDISLDGKMIGASNRRQMVKKSNLLQLNQRSKIRDKKAIA